MLQVAESNEPVAEWTTPARFCRRRRHAHVLTRIVRRKGIAAYSLRRWMLRPPRCATDLERHFRTMREQINLGTQGLRVPAIGLGCMGMSDFYGSASDAQSLSVLDRAADLGAPSGTRQTPMARSRTKSCCHRHSRGAATGSSSPPSLAWPAAKTAAGKGSRVVRTMCGRAAMPH